MNRLAKKLTRYKLITFDVTDTLLEYRMDPGSQYAEAGLMFGVHCEPQELSANVKRQVKCMSRLHPNFGRYDNMPWESWWRKVVFNSFKDCSNGNEINEHSLTCIADQLIIKYEDASVWRVVDGSRNLLNCLKQNNICIGIISNFDTRLKNILRNMNLDKDFKFIITSYVVNCEKPDVEIFEKALQQSGVPGIKPKHAIHIGNTPLKDYIGARNAGWNAILMTTERKLNSVLNTPNINHHHVYTSFKKLQEDLINDNIKW
uniref:Putative reg-2-like protein n=1 Tax=Xenopsylla cheopis TaxID=163159 RepID=A0A6M2DUF1_XENCH